MDRYLGRGEEEEEFMDGRIKQVYDKEAWQHGTLWSSVGRAFTALHV